ncbi:hypothetical protein, partial [Achromobacter anxifer]|uniref:hypothetical protein n=1 Tax=Achromobacter anxifer TaxID=1287737 RepID=UPI001C375C4D
YFLLHLATNFTLRRLRDIAVSAAEKRDYEEVFIACQASVTSIVSPSCLRPLQVHPSLAAIEISGLTLSFRQLPSLKL